MILVWGRMGATIVRSTSGSAWKLAEIGRSVWPCTQIWRDERERTPPPRLQPLDLTGGGHYVNHNTSSFRHATRIVHPSPNIGHHGAHPHRRIRLPNRRSSNHPSPDIRIRQDRDHRPMRLPPFAQRRAPVHRRHRQGVAGCRIALHRRVRIYRQSGVSRRTRQDAASEGTRRPARCAGQCPAREGHDRQRHRPN
jgi:hypothetical protein